MLRHRQDAGATRLALTTTACLVLLLALGALTARYIFVDLPSEIATRATNHAVDAARRIAREVSDALQVQPRVTVAHRTIVEQQNEVMQLVTLEKSVTERRRIDDSWLHSTKTLDIEGDFVVHVGFDLTKPFVIQVDQAGAIVRVSLPPAEILGVDLRDVRFLQDEDGLWNKLTPADREEALHNLRALAGQHARESDLPRQARELAEKRLAGILASDGRSITFEPVKAK